ncbi:MAG: hypothetical protein ACQERB_03010 [Promethearchaeati archaeon]
MENKNKGNPIEIWLKYCEDTIKILIDKGSEKVKETKEISEPY